MKQRIPNATYSTEFREQAVRKVTEEGLNPKEVVKPILYEEDMASYFDACLDDAGDDPAFIARALNLSRKL